MCYMKDDFDWKTLPGSIQLKRGHHRLVSKIPFKHWWAYDDPTLNAGWASGLGDV